MKKQSRIWFLLFIWPSALMPCAAQVPDSSVSRIDTVIRQMYQSLSFQAGNTAGLDRLKHVFLADGKLIANYGATPQIWTVAEYIAAVRENIAKQDIRELEEKEVFAKTEVFGKIAQRFSTYQIRLISQGKTSMRQGINAIQLIQQNGKWVITSLVWDWQSESLRIPAEYLPK